MYFPRAGEKEYLHPLISPVLFIYTTLLPFSLLTGMPQLILFEEKLRAVEFY
jgi:hypothetical protein